MAKTLQEFFNTLIELHGDKARAWQSTLSERIEVNAKLFQVKPTGDYVCGDKGIIVACENNVCIKIAFDEEEFLIERMSLVNWQSVPEVVRVIDYNESALLMEQLAPGALDLFDPLELNQGFSIIASLHKAPQFKPPGIQDAAARLDKMIVKVEQFRKLNSDVSAMITKQDMAMAGKLADRIAQQQGPQRVVCHGDLHPGNFMRRNSELVVIDPLPLWAEPVYDYAHFIRQSKDVSVLEQQFTVYSDLYDLDRQKLSDWSYFLLYQQIAILTYAKMRDQEEISSSMQSIRENIRASF